VIASDFTISGHSITIIEDSEDMNGIGSLLRTGSFAFCGTKIRAGYRCMNEASFSVQLTPSGVLRTFDLERAERECCSRECVQRVTRFAMLADDAFAM
jgi:hypothetical protein